jgi:hypothetical protein
MADKKKNIVSTVFIDFLKIVFTIFKIVPNFIYLIESEAKLAGKSIASILILYLMTGTVLTAIWFCLLAMCFLGLTLLHLNPLLSLLIIVVFNIILLIIIALLISKSKRDISFTRTRELMRRVKKS